MSFDRARLTHAHKTPESTNGLRGLISVLLAVAVTFSLSFILGGPRIQTQTELGRHDSVSVDSGTPTTWFRRGDSRIDKSTVGVDCELMTEDDLDLLDVEVRPADEPSPLAALIAFPAQIRPAAPVRGPPRSNDRV